MSVATASAAHARHSEGADGCNPPIRGGQAHLGQLLAESRGTAAASSRPGRSRHTERARRRALQWPTRAASERPSSLPCTRPHAEGPSAPPRTRYGAASLRPQRAWSTTAAAIAVSGCRGASSGCIEPASDGGARSAVPSPPSSVCRQRTASSSRALRISSVVRAARRAAHCRGTVAILIYG